MVSVIYSSPRQEGLTCLRALKTFVEYVDADEGLVADGLLGDEMFDVLIA